MKGAYAIANHDLVLDGRERRYELRIRDLPDEDRPREKLLESGPGALSIHELLAVVLMSGTKSEGVLAMSQRILREYGERSALSATNAARMAEELQIPVGKAAQIVACGELGRRFFKGSRDGAAVIRTARDVYEYTADMRNLPKEHLRGLYLNTHYQVIHDETISIGTVDANMVHPREVFRPAFAVAAAGVVLVHNHPSGIAEPSPQDKQVTKQIAEAGKLLGIDLVDHVIVTRDSFSSVSPDHE
jgi:DNA repair protein RadC